MVSGGDLVFDRGAFAQSCHDTARIRDDTEVRRYIVERGFLFARPSGSDRIFGHDHLIAVEERVMHRRADADIRDDAHHNDGGNLKVPQREVKISVEESRIASLDYKNVFG